MRIDADSSEPDIIYRPAQIRNALSVSGGIGIDTGITLCYPYSMKTAISIPDELFGEIEKFAKGGGGKGTGYFFTGIVRPVVLQPEQKLYHPAERRHHTVDNHCNQEAGLPTPSNYRIVIDIGITIGHTISMTDMGKP